ncbi:MAG: alpha/beta fold hydrolase [Actinomycetota bacterium]
MRLRSLLGAALAGGAAIALRRSFTAKEKPPEEPRRRRQSRLADALDPSRDIPLKAPVPPALPRGSLANVPERGEMFYRHAGDPTAGTPVLLLHGWMASADLNWWPVYEGLAAEHPLIAPDHRGHGRGIRSVFEFTLEDCAEDAAALLRHLGIARAVVVGYSMGGPIATLLWRRHPELVAGLVLEATALEWSSGRWERWRWNLMGLVGGLLRYPTGRLILARLIGGRTEVPEPLKPHRSWIDGEFRRNDPGDLAEAGRALGRYDARSFFEGVDTPIAVVVTTRDSLVPADKQRELARATNAKVFDFNGDHDSAIVQGPEFARVTLDAIEAVTS